MSSQKHNVSHSLASLRYIRDINEMSYPSGIHGPDPELNKDAGDGKFRYDREFLLQFMNICKDKPNDMSSLKNLGLSVVELKSSMSLGCGHPVSAPCSFRAGYLSPLTTASRRASSGQGITSLGQLPGMSIPEHATGQFSTPKINMASGCSFIATAQQQLDPVTPLEQSPNRWVPTGAASRRPPQQDEDSPLAVDKKVRALLNKLTMEKFDSISNHIIAWANKSENETDGRTLIQVIRLVYNSLEDERWAEMYARLCRKMMEQISPNVQDDGIRNAEGKPITGGQLFRKYLLNRCQEKFERGLSHKEATAAAAASNVTEEKATKETDEKIKVAPDEGAHYSEESYSVQKAKRQGLGLVKFLGELFKLRMLTERIMHECIRKLLNNVDNPEEEEIKSLCNLLTSVGQSLDSSKAKGHIDIYFSQMNEPAKSNNVTSRMQFMLLDVIELRARRWNPRGPSSAPTTIAQIHDDAAKEKGQQEKDSLNRSNMSRGGRQQAKAGDLTHFGKITKSSGKQMSFLPTSVFNRGPKRDSAPLARTSSSTKMFSALQNAEAANEAPASAPTSRQSRPPSHLASVDLTQSQAEATPPSYMTQLPRLKPVNPPEIKQVRMNSSSSAIRQQELEPVIPLVHSENRWTPSKFAEQNQGLCEKAQCKARALLNKLTITSLTQISEEIAARASNSEAFPLVIRLIFERATSTSEATWLGLYARLCKEMMEKVSFVTMDMHPSDTEHDTASGDQLLKGYLLKYCRESFKDVWMQERDRSQDDPSVQRTPRFDEVYSAKQAQLQRLNLVEFIGELFNLQLLTGRFIHECIKKLLSRVGEPDEDKIECLCALLTTAGQALDFSGERGPIDIYFRRMRELAKGNTFRLRIQRMLQNIIELRECFWETRGQAIAADDESESEDSDDKGLNVFAYFPARNAGRNGSGHSGYSPEGTREGYPRTSGTPLSHA